MWTSSIPPTAEKGEGLRSPSGLHPERMKHLYEREAIGSSATLQERRGREMRTLKSALTLH